MPTSPTPDLSADLSRRIRLVRRDIGDLLCHFTRGADPVYEDLNGIRVNTAESAENKLTKILRLGALLGSSKWTHGIDTVCFTEAPIHEFNALMELASIATEQHQRPRYEPYGVAVSKSWLFGQGGRPVIYDSPAAEKAFPKKLKYRYCRYDPINGDDYTWEREWRIATTRLQLDPKQTLVIVPSASEAFDIVHSYGQQCDRFIKPTWLAVSLDMFG